MVRGECWPWGFGMIFFLSTNSGEKLRVQIRQRIFFLYSAGQTNKFKCHYELCFWNECNWPPTMAICKIWQLYHQKIVELCVLQMLLKIPAVDLLWVEFFSNPFSRVCLHVKNMAPWESLLQQLAGRICESSVDWMGSLHFFGWNPKNHWI